MIRTAAFFSPHEPHNFAAAAERALRGGRTFGASRDHVVTPTYLPDLADACLDLVIDRATATWHLTSGKALSWFDFAGRIADALALDRRLVVPATTQQLGWRAPRPLDAALRSDRGDLLPSLADALSRHARCRADDRAAIAAMSFAAS